MNLVAGLLFLSSARKNKIIDFRNTKRMPRTNLSTSAWRSSNSFDFSSRFVCNIEMSPSLEAFTVAPPMAGVKINVCEWVQVRAIRNRTSLCFQQSVLILQLLHLLRELRHLGFTFGYSPLRFRQLSSQTVQLAILEKQESAIKIKEHFSEYLPAL
jgi:hypothetical protein